ncbi:MAG: ABC transporter substrate-binding protein [Thermodesulfobacteriota bacterium]
MSATGLLVDAPFYIGKEKGYFKQQGIEVKLTTFRASAKAMAPLSTGELDVASGGINVGLFNSVAGNWPIVVVASRPYLIPGNDGDGIMVRADLIDKIHWNFMNPNGYVNPRSIEDQQNWYFAHRFIDSEDTAEQDR